MTRKHIITIISLSLLAFFANSQEYMPISSPKTGYVTDMVLLYQGDKPDIKYTPSNIKPYIYRIDFDNKFQWLYDSFLFLAARHPNRKVFDGTWGKNSARKEEWSWIIDELFHEGQAIDAVESIMDSLALAGKKSIRKKKIIVSVPQAIPNQKDWGYIEGRAMDFSLDKDRITASKWFINEVLKRWNKKKYKYIELAGFYYFKENNRGDEELMKKIGEHVKKSKYIYYWIPYLWAPGFDKAAELGFDVAYQQPNYFFKKSNLAPQTRMDLVLNHAKKHNMGLEMEFNNDIQYVFFQMRFLDYLNWFEKYGVWENSTVGYYQDFQTFKNMSLSEDPVIRILYDKLCNIIDKRQKKADTIFLKDKK